MQIFVKNLLHFLWGQYQIQTAPPRGANWKSSCLSPHGALRAYTVFLQPSLAEALPWCYLRQ